MRYINQEKELVICELYVYEVYEMSQRWCFLAHIFMLESILSCSVVNRAQIATHLACICLKTLKCSYTYTRTDFGEV